MALSKKHYEMLAGILRDARLAWNDTSPVGEARIAGKAIDTVTFALAEELSWDNPRFDPNRFKDAAHYRQPPGGWPGSTS